MTKIGQKHLIECNCVLPQYKNQKTPIFHKFIVFSIIDENDEVEPKIVQCPNCGIVHKVVEIGQSEILRKENIYSVRSIKDICMSLPESIVGLLEAHNCDLPTYEEIEFLIDNKMWEQEVIISREHTDEGQVFGKILILKNQDMFPGIVKIQAFNREEYLK